VKLYSTNHSVDPVNFEEAVFKGLPEDNGLFMPVEIPALPAKFIENIEQYSFQEIAFTVAHTLIGDEIPEADLRPIIEDAINFDAPVIPIHDNFYCLELFHGPSLAFKDFGARFMSRVMSYFLEKNQREINILVATSGDTGSAVGQGFYKVPGINVTILYPSGKVSKNQEKQLTTLGENITALEIDGNFDDCQKLVKTAFLDKELNEKMNLSSANSINIARLIPQSFYYFNTYKQLKSKGLPVVFSVPSGNFGNLCGGLIAMKMGLPIDHFIAVTNINNIVPSYLETGIFEAKPSKATISNAMDVGNPSNFVRLIALFGDSYDEMTKHVTGQFFTDEETRQAILDVYTETGYVMCPHTAIGYLGLQKTVQEKNLNVSGVVLGTAHPAKFKDIVDPVLKQEVKIPQRLLNIIDQEKVSIEMKPDFEAFKRFLMER
jgi:threonine synthase